MAWNKTIEIDWSGETFEENRDATVAALRASGWTAENEDVDALVEELEDTDTYLYFDNVWNFIYDEADYDRVWLEVKR